MAIEGAKRKNTTEQRVLKTGLFEGKVIAINPNEEEFKERLGIELQEDSKATEYLGESKDGNTYLRLSVWLEEKKTGEKFNMNLFLENKERENNDKTKKQYINTSGSSSWAEDPNNLPDWFTKREYRVAMQGEEDLYTFMRSWLAELDYMDESTVLELDWKKLMKGNVKELKEQIDGSWSKEFVSLATVITKERDGEIKEYQGVYNKVFLPAYALKFFRMIDYKSPDIIETLKSKKTRDLKVQEKFVLNVMGQYGCKDFFILKDLKEYDPADNVMATNEAISEEDSSY
jgi:hypothetical protein